MCHRKRIGGRQKSLSFLSFFSCRGIPLRPGNITNSSLAGTCKLQRLVSDLTAEKLLIENSHFFFFFFSVFDVDDVVGDVQENEPKFSGETSSEQGNYV